MSIVDNHKERFDKAIDHFRTDIASLRTGRATPALVEDVSIEAYGTKQQLKGLASITVADAKTITVEPWDKSVMQDVEIGLRNADIGINPVNDGTLIRLTLPELTAERRQDLIKVLHQKSEQARIAIRQTREDVKSEIEQAEKDKEVTEDERFGLIDDLDKLVKEYNEQVKQIATDKETEINTI